MSEREQANRCSVLMVSSSGGVLLDLLALKPWWERLDTRWVAVPAADTEETLSSEEVLWRDEASLDRPFALARAISEARRRLRQRRPAIVMSAGSGIAVPWFAAARSIGLPCTWVETLNLVGPPGKAATICQRLATRVLVQRPALVASRHRAAFVGQLY